MGNMQKKLKAQSHLDVWREQVNIVWENQQSLEQISAKCKHFLWKENAFENAANLFRHHCINSSPFGQNDHHFTDIFKCIFLNENVWIVIKISLKFVPQGPIDNNEALV